MQWVLQLGPHVVDLYEYQNRRCPICDIYGIQLGFGSGLGLGLGLVAIYASIQLGSGLRSGN